MEEKYKHCLHRNYDSFLRKNVSKATQISKTYSKIADFRAIYRRVLSVNSQAIAILIDQAHRLTPTSWFVARYRLPHWAPISQGNIYGNSHTSLKPELNKIVLVNKANKLNFLKETEFRVPIIWQTS